MLGSMGLASSIGLGLSLSIDKNVISIDGDGSVLMNMNTLATIGNRAPPNYTLLIIDKFILNFSAVETMALVSLGKHEPP